MTPPAPLVVPPLVFVKDFGNWGITLLTFSFCICIQNFTFIYITGSEKQNFKISFSKVKNPIVFVHHRQRKIIRTCYCFGNKNPSRLTSYLPMLFKKHMLTNPIDF